MPDLLAISDLVLFPLEREDARLTILRQSDHLLRRFGLLEIIDLAPDEAATFTLRAEADELWALLAGAAELTLVDHRPASPSRGERVQLMLDASDPQGVLIPFGVAHAFSAADPARLLRLSTHAEAHPQDRRGPVAELDLPLSPDAAR